MISAAHSYFAELVFKPYIFRLLKRSFHSVNIIGDVPEINDDYPLILVPNHSTWWDGFFVYLLNKKYFNRFFFIMILEEQLEKYKFFTKLGGFSISKKSPKSIIESLKYSADILRKFPNSVTTIFPQGELLPNFIEPLNFNKGIEKILQFYGGKVNLLPLTIKIEYLNEEKASVFFSFGKPLISGHNDDNITAILKEEVTQGLEKIKENILKGDLGKVILSGKVSVSEKSKNAFKIIKKSKFR